MFFFSFLNAIVHIIFIITATCKVAFSVSTENSLVQFVIVSFLLTQNVITNLLELLKKNLIVGNLLNKAVGVG